MFQICIIIVWYGSLSIFSEVFIIIYIHIFISIKHFLSILKVSKTFLLKDIL